MGLADTTWAFMGFHGTSTIAGWSFGESSNVSWHLVRLHAPSKVFMGFEDTFMALKERHVQEAEYHDKFATAFMKSTMKVSTRTTVGLTWHGPGTTAVELP